jgi:hypothetical protein
MQERWNKYYRRYRLIDKRFQQSVFQKAAPKDAETRLKTPAAQGID